MSDKEEERKDIRIKDFYDQKNKELLLHITKDETFEELYLTEDEAHTLILDISTWLGI